MSFCSDLWGNILPPSIIPPSSDIQCTSIVQANRQITLVTVLLLERDLVCTVLTIIRTFVQNIISYLLRWLIMMVELFFGHKRWVGCANILFLCLGLVAKNGYWDFIQL
jgi:hypothetical protein